MRFTKIDVFKSTTLPSFLEMVAIHFFGGDTVYSDGIVIAESLFQTYLNNNDIEEVGLLLENFDSSHTELADADMILTEIQTLFDEIGEYMEGQYIVEIKVHLNGPDLIVYSKPA